jgi:hypothetical protein
LAHQFAIGATTGDPLMACAGDFENDKRYQKYNDQTNATIQQEPRKIAQQPLGEFFSL